MDDGLILINLLLVVKDTQKMTRLTQNSFLTSFVTYRDIEPAKAKTAQHFPS
jgi:hypothetical protein